MAMITSSSAKENAAWPIFLRAGGAWGGDEVCVKGHLMVDGSYKLKICPVYC
jgi:hypothetical protein